MTQCMRVAIVDDEGLARRGIRARLSREPDVVVVAEARNVDEAAMAIRLHRPDLVFLDIEMPGADGFALVERIRPEPPPLVVFVTAHEDHALRAFDVAAFDYVLKPIDDDRFAQTLCRARTRLARQDGEPEGRIVIRDRGQLVLLSAATIDWVQSDGDYVRIHAGARNYLHHSTLTALAAELPDDLFIRIHRSAVVNVRRIELLQPLTNGDYDVLLTTGARLRLSRTHREALGRTLGRLL